MHNTDNTYTEFTLRLQRKQYIAAGNNAGKEYLVRDHGYL